MWFRHHVHVAPRGCDSLSFRGFLAFGDPGGSGELPSGVLGAVLPPGRGLTFSSWLDWGGGFGDQDRRGEAPPSPPITVSRESALSATRHGWRRPWSPGRGGARQRLPAKCPSPSPGSGSGSVHSPRRLLPLPAPPPATRGVINASGTERSGRRCAVVPRSPETSPGPEHCGESESR